MLVREVCNYETYLSEVPALVEDVIQHDAVERGFFQEEVHSNWSVVADVEFPDFEEATAVAQTPDRCLYG